MPGQISWLLGGGCTSIKSERALRNYLGHCVFYNFLVFHIALVAHKKLVDAFGCVTIDFLKPLFDVVEGIHVGHIVDNADAMGTTVVR